MPLSFDIKLEKNEMTESTESKINSQSDVQQEALPQPAEIPTANVEKTKDRLLPISLVSKPQDIKDIIEEYASSVLAFNLEERITEKKVSLEYDTTGKTAYLQICKLLNIIPCSYFIRNLKQNIMKMRYYGLGPIGTRAVCHALYTNPYIQKLDLSHNCIGEDGATYVADLLKESSFISEANLSYNNLGSTGARLIGELLYSNPAHLKKINLSGNNFKDNDATHIAYGLDGNDRLVEIDLSHNKFGILAGQTLGVQLANNNILESVNLSWNYFKGTGIPPLCASIKQNLQLTSLDLSWNGLHDEGGLILAKGLHANTTLQNLNITNTLIGNTGTNAIARALEKNDVLSSLMIGINPFDYDVATLLLKCIVKNGNSAIKELDLTNICVTREFENLYFSLKESRNITIRYEGLTKDYNIPIKTRRSTTNVFERLSRAKLVAKIYSLKLEKFLSNLERDVVTAHELRTILERSAKPKLNRVHADEIAICLSTDGNVYLDQIIEELEKIPDPESEKSK